MTFPDTSLERTGVDPAVSEMIHGMPADSSTNHQPTPNGHAEPVTERVFAPASERVPVAPVPGHRDMVNHTDSTTPERLAHAPTAPVTSPRWDYRQSHAAPAGPSKLALGLSVSWASVLVASIGVWLTLRWRNERNKPINRLRRQAKNAASRAKHAAAAVSDRVPSEVYQPRAIHSLRWGRS